MPKIRRNQMRMDSDLVAVQETKPPAVLTAEEQELIKLSQQNTKFEQDDLVIPFLKILQPLSKIIQSIPDSKPGMFYNTNSKRLISGIDGFICIILGHNHKVLECIPRKEGGGIIKNWENDPGWKTLCAPDQRDAYQPVTKNGHDIVKIREFLIFVIDPKTGEIDPAFFPHANTGLNSAKQISSMLMQTRIRLSNGQIITPPYYYFVYKCVAEQRKNDKGFWWVPNWSKHSNGSGEHMKTKDLPNGQQIFEHAKLLQTQYQEGAIHPESYSEDNEIQHDDLEAERVAF